MNASPIMTATATMIIFMPLALLQAPCLLFSRASGWSPSRPAPHNSSDPSLSRHPPDHVADVVGDQERAVRAESHSDRPSVGRSLVWRKEARDDIARRSGRTAVGERHEHNLVAGERAAVPGAMLADRHALGKPGKGAGRQPAKTERGGVAA